MVLEALKPCIIVMNSIVNTRCLKINKVEQLSCIQICMTSQDGLCNEGLIDLLNNVSFIVGAGGIRR